MMQIVLIFLAVLPVVCVAGWLWGTYSPRPRAGSRPADDPGGGFATAEQLHARLSAEAVRAAGAQVRPGLARPVLEPAKATRRRGLTRGR
ncbi:hypothetical protein ACIOJE_34970 [Kitasatospora sp. NPDC087861]|uniref:hypothetical protein n=1 Tax=Kitasatospora sp. NPDC087861 TaxID=3364070 RepID=UPI0037FB38FE